MALVRIDWSPSLKQLRSFGLTALVVFGLVGIVAHARLRFMGMHLSPGQGRLALEIGLGTAGACAILAFVAPTWLRPLYLALSILAMPIGFVASWVMLVVVYFVVVTPIALIARLFTTDEIRRRADPNASTYYTKLPTDKSRSSYLRQY